jgi:putative transposase
MLINKRHPLSIKKQCEALSIHRGGLYYKAKGESGFNLELMRKIDEKYLKTPFYGVPRMWIYLRQDLGYKISRKRVERLYRLMGLAAIGPKPNTSKPAPGHKVYPYLLRGLKTERNNQVWAADITYIPMRKGFMYLMAIIDLNSRYVLNWSVSNSMEAEWCAQVLSGAIEKHGKPEIINTDQGSQFTSEDWITACEGIKISMDGKGRAIDNIFIERLWRSLKYEYVYPNPANDGLVLYEGLKTWFRFYNSERRHQGLDYKTPETIYRIAA